ncbi:hypothetical protein G9C85_04265 [Halorubellus sp. JP-L1]|uniref:hypothetical protein n=1 Tax=Halorubellus sp. JP-L1 TaxID=2715753 RepID=UPI0014077B9D|nr:hypothetical protein [Halorubellus sp. JP-L1]NHN40848.1 hypothetical protein [Halorubellus sp. JP-L1]
MMDERTRRAGERAAAARRRAFSVGDARPASASPIGLVPVLLLCLVGAVVDAYGVLAFDAGVAVEAASGGLAAFAVVAAFALAIGHSWAWTITWLYLAVHVFFDILAATFVGPIALAVAVVYALALTYATTRRVVEVAGQQSME